MKRTIAVSVTILILFVLALACSGSHRPSDASSAGVTTPWGEATAGFGTWTCQDACACQPPEEFQILGFGDMKANDVCGNAFNCRYRCSADCAKP